MGEETEITDSCESAVSGISSPGFLIRGFLLYRKYCVVIKLKSTDQEFLFECQFNSERMHENETEKQYNQ